MRRLVIASAAILASGAWWAQASAAPVGYSVAKIQDIARIGGVNDLDQIVFETGGGKVLSLYDGGTLTALTPAAGPADILYGATLNNAGQIAYNFDTFSGGVSSTSLRILDGGTFITIAGASQPGFSRLEFDASKINENGQVAYTGPLPTNFSTVGGRNLFLWDGSASVTLVDTGVADGDFFDVAGAGLNNTGLVAFSANKFAVSGMGSGTTQTSVFVNDGATNTVVIDGPNGPFKQSATAAINDSGQIVFLGVPDGGNNAGLYITDGVTTDLIADLLDQGDTFVASMNNQGLVVANIATSINSGGAVLASTLSLFRNGVAEALYSTGDVLDGLVIARTFLGKDAINEDGDFTFALTFTNGTSATYFASALAGQVPLPAAAWMFLAGIGALASSRGRRGRGARETARWAADRRGFGRFLHSE